MRGTVLRRGVTQQWQEGQPPLESRQFLGHAVRVSIEPLRRSRRARDGVRSGELKDVVAIVADNAAAFELGVVCEVFGLDRSADGLPCYDFAVATMNPGPVRTSSGFTIAVEHG